MSPFRRARTSIGRQYQRAAIARNYATRWREADPAELPGFVRRVNECATATGTLPHEIYVNARRREIMLCVGRHDYRVIVRPGVDVVDTISAEDVERFERRSGE